MTCQQCGLFKTVYKYIFRMNVMAVLNFRNGKLKIFEKSFENLEICRNFNYNW